MTMSEPNYVDHRNEKKGPSKMRPGFTPYIAALVGVAMLVLAGIGGYAYGKASRACEVTVSGKSASCDSLVTANDQNIASLNRANVVIAHGNAIMRAMYEDLRATKVAFADANAVIEADARAINAFNGNETLIPYALGQSSQALQTATAASGAMRSADRAYAAAVKANPLSIEQ